MAYNEISEEFMDDCLVTNVKIAKKKAKERTFWYVDMIWCWASMCFYPSSSSFVVLMHLKEIFVLWRKKRNHKFFFSFLCLIFSMKQIEIELGITCSFSGASMHHWYCVQYIIGQMIFNLTLHAGLFDYTFWTIETTKSCF